MVLCQEQFAPLQYLLQSGIYIHLHLHYKQVRRADQLFHEVYAGRDKTAQIYVYKTEKITMQWFSCHQPIRIEGEI